MIDEELQTNLDARAFLKTRTILWAIDSDNLRAPLLKGNVLIPVRLYDFCYQKCRFEHFFGEKCVKLNLQYWQNIHQKKFNKYGNPPDYLGTTYVNTPSIIKDERHYYQEARKIRNFGLSYNNPL